MVRPWVVWVLVQVTVMRRCFWFEISVVLYREETEVWVEGVRLGEIHEWVEEVEQEA